jgi:LysR family glycine cleavage system transcriptional activator
MADDRVFVISAPPGFTSKWLAPRLYRFSAAYPQIEARVSSSTSKANFTTDGVDVAIRSMRVDGRTDDPRLAIEKLYDLSLITVCSPTFIATRGPFDEPKSLLGAPLIHDDMFATYHADSPSWADWFRAAGIDDVDASRGLRFNSADHALDAAGEGAGVLLTADLLTYDDVRTGRLVVPFDLALPSRWAYHFVCLKSRSSHPHVQAFRNWIKQEMAAVQQGKSRRAAPLAEASRAERGSGGARRTRRA